jgi:hypothetical protein
MKRVTVVGVVLALGAGALADDKKANARTAVERYVAAALAGKVEEAAGLAVSGQSPSRKKNIEEFKAMVDAKKVQIPTVWADEAKGRATAVSEKVRVTQANPDGRDTGYLTFLLNKSGGEWRVKDIDFKTEKQAREQVEKFRKKYPDAKELTAKSEG